MQVAVVIGDLVQSRDINDRAAFQRKFGTAVEGLNAQYRALSPYTITLGDEIQAVCSRTDFLFRSFWSMNASLAPIRIRFSVGIGNLTTDVNEAEAIGMDGPAFHLARAGIDELKRTGQSILIQSVDPPLRPLIQRAASLLSLHTASWRPNRWKILARVAAGHSTSQIADELRISKVAVHANRKRGAIGLVLSTGDEISAQVDRMVRGEP